MTAHTLDRPTARPSHPRHLADPSPRTAARIAGIGYVAIFGLALFANFAVRERLVDPDDAAATFRDIAAHHGLVRWAIAAFLAVFVADVAIAWALHHVFRPVGAAMSSLAAWFRIVYTVFLGVALLFLFAALRLTGDADYLSTLDQGQREAHTMLALDAFNATWLIGLVTFGVHLVLIGGIMLRSGIAPASLGWVLTAAGTAYVLDTLGLTLIENYADHQSFTEPVIIVVAVAAEAYFTGWLLRRGWRGRTADAAPVDASRDDATSPALAAV